MDITGLSRAVENIGIAVSDIEPAHLGLDAVG
jgi:hypothetical protein